MEGELLKINWDLKLKQRHPSMVPRKLNLWSFWLLGSNYLCQGSG